MLVFAYALLLLTGYSQLPWAQYLQEGVADKVTSTVKGDFNTVKLQIDTCNVKSLTYAKYVPGGPRQEKNMYMLVEFYRTVPLGESDGTYSGIASSAQLPITERAKVLDEIEQRKPSCPKDVPIMAYPLN